MDFGASLPTMKHAPATGRLSVETCTVIVVQKLTASRILCEESITNMLWSPVISAY